MKSIFLILMILISFSLMLTNITFAQTENGTTGLQDNGTTGTQDNEASKNETPGPMIITEPATSTQQAQTQETEPINNPDSSSTTTSQESEPANNNSQPTTTIQSSSSNENKVAKNNCNGLNDCSGCIDKKLVKTFCCTSSKNKSGQYANGCDDF